MPGARRLQPVRREPAAISIAQQLTEAIMDGTLAPGSQLGEAELAAELGVSRGPLREAMQRLVQQGIAYSEPHRGVFVTTLTVDDVRDIYVARTSVESAACRLILRRDPQGTAERLSVVHKAMADAAKRGDHAALSAADTELHQMLVNESGSPRLTRMAQTLFVETRMCISALQDKYQAPDVMVDEHAEIIRAMRDGHEERLLRLMDEHMQDAVQRLTEEPGTAPEDGAGAAVATGA
ncbi:GntR family transcriptional regulator [Streptomyces sp. TS71-3]|uniref:GntR family transcriptional regulator n=1 Tax=Streptomyces sp. TS71-3 TaxID=2733862 RepID=UPI001B2B3021|nr:GntR family transcriptional regulator [Streptomyces sp. TS71-3]GHJ35640.1 GntR family transcriptional regulator [Streptomyces sp. TS71-3]